MWSAGVTGSVGGGGLYAQNRVLPNSVPTASAADVAAVRQQVNEWLRSASGSKAQTASSLVDRLKLIRERTSDVAFKNNLNTLIQTIDHYVEAKAAGGQSMQQRFPDAGNSHNSRPPINNSHHRLVLNRSELRHTEHVSHNVRTQRASVNDFYTARSNPGRKPGVGNGPGSIWSGFKQGPNKSNCATVAAIKVAMMKFGQKPTDIFRQVIVSGNGWDIQMRDGRSYHLSRYELAQATYRSEFSGDNPAMVAHANFMYAVSAKREQVESNDGYAVGFERALYRINSGEPYGRNYNGLLRLGLSDHTYITRVENLARGQLGLVTHAVPINGQWVGHALAVINGREEVWGRQGGRPPTNIPANAAALF